MIIKQCNNISNFLNLLKQKMESSSVSYLRRYLTLHHVLIGIVSNREEMGWHFCLALSSVLVNYALRVDREASVRINCHAKQARISLHKLGTHHLIRQIAIGNRQMLTFADNEDIS